MPTIQAVQALTPTGWQNDIDVVIANDGRIQDIVKSNGNANFQVDILLPAPTNLHSHSFQRAMAGLTEARSSKTEDSFWTWRKLMFRFLEQLTPDHIEAIAAQAFMEMAEAGYSSVAEFHYIHHGSGGQPYENQIELSERIAAASIQTGLGLTHLPVHYEFGGCDRRSLHSGQKRFGTTKEQYEILFHATKGLIAAGPADWTLGSAAHSLRAVDEDGIISTHNLAEDRPFHMHLAEQDAEVSEVMTYLGARPVEWVLENLSSNSQCCFIHCTQMDDSETSRLAASGAVVGLCPITEANLGDGIFPGLAYTQATGYFGIGSDSNIQISLWDELKTLEYSQRLQHRQRSVLATLEQSTGRALYEAVCTGGRKATNRKNGSLAGGYWADMIGLSSNNEILCSQTGDTILDSLIFANHEQKCIEHVWSAGRHIVQHGRHIARETILQRFLEVMRELRRDI